MRLRRRTAGMRPKALVSLATHLRITSPAADASALGRVIGGFLLAAPFLAAVACGNPNPGVDPTTTAAAGAGAGDTGPLTESGDEAMDHEAMGHSPAEQSPPGPPDGADSAEDPSAAEHVHDDADDAFDSAAVRFAEEAFGDNDGDYGLTFAPDGLSVFFTRAIPSASSEAIYFSRLVDGAWSAPEVAPFSGRFHDKEPYVSPDGNRVYFASLRSLRGATARLDFDIWYAERGDGGWGDPVHIEALSSPYNDDYPAVAADGTLVFARNDDDDNIDLWIAAGTDGGFEEPLRLDRPIKSVYAEADPWIDPDGSSIIFSSPRITDGSQGQGDLYIVRRLGDGWTAPVSLGQHVNSIAHEYGPALSPDGETFFFSRGFGGHVWMVPTSVLEQLGGPSSR